MVKELFELEEEFQLTHPTRGATPSFGYIGILWFEISTHTPHTGCDANRRHDNATCKISTHTPHTGCDTENVAGIVGMGISTHTPHTGCDECALHAPAV